MNDWFAREWTGIAQTFEVSRTVKRKRRQVIEQLPAAEQTPPSTGPTQAPPSSKAKPPKTAKQVIFVEETSQQVDFGFSNLTLAAASPQAIAPFFRNHWPIDNRLHSRHRVDCHVDAAQE